MADGSSSPFRNLLKSVGIKGPAKPLKFMPNVTEPPSSDANKDTSTTTTLSQKEHRRAQVRRAQKLHRLHKKNYIKFLEQDVIRLREMISIVETETAVFQQENAAMKATLSRNSVQRTPVQLPVLDLQPFTSGISSPEAPSFQGSNPTRLGESQPHQQSPQWATESTTSSSTTISVDYDERINARRLRVSPASDFGSQDFRNTVRIPSAANVQAIPNLPDPALLFGDPPPQLANQNAPHTMPKQPNTSLEGINFILALEHPCRKHFHAPEAEFDPEGASSNHELMATALVYSQAPAPVFTDLETATWQSPELELVKLWEMSQSLPKDDWEITPVQAWFLLTAAYDAQALLAGGGARLDALMKGLARYVDCLGFGTVLDAGRFWGVVNSVMGTERAAASGLGLEGLW